MSDTQDEVKLSTVKPDYADLRTQLEALLQANPVWTDLVPAATGEILIKMVAGAGSYNQYTIERGVQETFLETARAPQNIYSLVRLLGVRLIRKTPHKTTVEFSQTGGTALVIPKYTLFSIDNQYQYYNEETVYVPVGTSITATLTEGELTIYEYTSDGSAFQQFLIGSSFTSSNILSRVFVDGKEWNRITTGIWLAREYEEKFSDQTTQLGNLEITFGDNANGLIPPIDSKIEIYEYRVQGSESLVTSAGLTVLSSDYPQLTGKTTIGLIGGSDEPTPSYYQYVAARIGRAAAGGDLRLVTRSDYQHGLLLYPGIIDCRSVGEWENNPPNLNMMNIINLYLITETKWDETDEEEFFDWLDNYAMQGVKHVIKPTTALPLIVNAQLLIKEGYTTDEVIASATQNLQNTYAISYGSLKKSVYKSDVYNTLMSTNGVQHVILNSPTADIIAGVYDYVSLRVEDGGSISLTAQYVGEVNG